MTKDYKQEVEAILLELSDVHGSNALGETNIPNPSEKATQAILALLHQAEVEMIISEMQTLKDGLSEIMVKFPLDKGVPKALQIIREYCEQRTQDTLELKAQLAKKDGNENN